MAHGYLGDGYGSHGEIEPNDDNRDRRERDHDRDRDFRARDRRDESDDDYRNRGRDDRGFILGDEDRFYGRSESRPSDRGVQSWNRDSSERWPERQGRSSSYNRQSEDYSGQGRRNFSAHPDDHYRSWRDRHMEALDRDYADYCREREQHFHRDFDQWRSNRSQNISGSGERGSSDETTLELSEPRAYDGDTLGGPSPEGEATLGTNTPENARKGRGGR